MTRNYGLPRPPFQRKPVPASLRRLGIALLIGAGVAIVAAWPAPAQTVTCNQLGCSDNPGVKPQRKVRVDPHGNSVSLAGIVAPLRAKAQEIVRACGSRVVSAYRPGARIPTGRISNHARHRAVDLRGNPSCIYAHLKGWPGGYSVDYVRAPGGPHVHVSFNRNMEWGARFSHRRTRTYHARAK